jgi:hypothetical protein
VRNLRKRKQLEQSLLPAKILPTPLRITTIATSPRKRRRKKRAPNRAL